MKTGAILCLVVLLIACEYEGMPPVDAVPARQIHYNFETGERVGVTTFTYNGNSQLLYERFTNEGSIRNTFEVVYERDGQGRVVTRKERYPETTNEYYVIETTYNGALKASEKKYYTDSPEGVFSEDVYYYSGDKIGKIEILDGSKQLVTTQYYTYDDQGRLTAITNQLGIGTTYKYDGDKLVEQCDAYSRCLINEYNRAGQLVKISERDYDDRIQVNEEYSYKDGLLVEKIQYTHNAYLSPGMVSIWRIKYEY